jgi:ABC-2 type transport system ATP-binding protein
MLDIRRLGFRYPGADDEALHEVNLQVGRGHVLGLLGPNGAGKTTLISHLSGALALQSGDILVDGQALARVRERTPTRIAVAPQDFAFYPMLSVRQNLECFAAAARIARVHRPARVQACLAAAQLQRCAAMRAEQLSGGLKRRLNLAIALLPEPELIVFDEPTVGVDPQTRAFVLEAIRGLARGGAAVIYTSHYMEEIEAIADRVLILDQGRVLREGTLEALLGEGVQMLSVAVNGMPEPALRALLGRYGVLDATAVAHAVADATPAAVRLRLAAPHRPAEVLAALDAAGVELRHAEFGRANLEHLFMALTQRRLRD